MVTIWPRPVGGPLWVGLTGGIGSGKSTVARLLSDLGATIVDTDAISRALTGPGGAAMSLIRETFGPDVVQADGALDRSRMRQRLIDEPDTKRQLEALLHPLIAQEALHQAQQSSAPVVVFDVPLLAESAAVWVPRVHRVAVVDCSPQRQRARVMARNGWPVKQVEAIMALQASREKRLSLADDVINNDHDEPQLLNQAVRAVWAHWLHAGAAAEEPAPTPVKQ
jgi:dephospho-CoA kinase